MASYGPDEGKGFPYLLPSVVPGADHGVQAVSQVSISHPPSGRLPLLSARPAITFQAIKHHRPLAGTHFTRVGWTPALNKRTNERTSDQAS